MPLTHKMSYNKCLINNVSYIMCLIHSALIHNVPCT